MDRELILEDAKSAIIDGNASRAVKKVQEWLAMNYPPLELIEEGLSPAIREVGDLWGCGEYFLPELVSGAEAMKAALAELQPSLNQSLTSASSHKSVIIGTVEGDIHDIGKSLVASMLRAHGYEVSDLGADVSAQEFLTAARKTKASLVCISALLTTTMTGIKDVINLFKRDSPGADVKFLVGGAPVTMEWALSIGADGYGSNAIEAVAAANALTAQ
jgi:5-methyltetrahydrofolate--homocysteine methyltransferase